MKPEIGRPIPQELGSVHFIGVAGSGMSGIARVLKEKGLSVTGSDRADSEVAASLRDAGIPVFIGHDATQVGPADTVVAENRVCSLLSAIGKGLSVEECSVAVVANCKFTNKFNYRPSNGKCFCSDIFCIREVIRRKICCMNASKNG